jgi:hypothetical protein
MIGRQIGKTRPHAERETFNTVPDLACQHGATGPGFLFSAAHAGQGCRSVRPSCFFADAPV